AGGLSIALGIIGAAGFKEQVIGEPPVLAQPVSAQAAIRLIMALAPLVFLTVGILVSARYKLNKDNHARVLAAMEGPEEERAAALAAL
ncbi:MAG: hypothetical protein FWC27_02795, partial [Firmicutes bacterium]|nr:hypothetical protein [Bacillota bacterium]